MKLALVLLVATAVLARSPSGGYAPAKVSCPDGDLVRVANNKSQAEEDWLEGRAKVANKHLEIFLSESNLDDFDASSFLKNTSDGRNIKIGLAFSGGGYRAMFCGAGQLAGLDNRTRGAHEHGLGGLLESSTYLSGLSGGNWLVGSLVTNNYTSVQDILDKNEIWDITHSIVNMGGWNPVKIYKYYKNLYDTAQDKEDAGFELSLTDTWARALSHQFFTEDSGYGASVLWSDIQDMDAFKNYEMPFPVVVTDGRTPGTKVISGNSTIFEVNPFEMGSWDPSLNAFHLTKYLGSESLDGHPENKTCVAGFDNAGFIMGTSSTLFNQFVLQINTTSLSSTVKSLVTSILNKVSHEEDDIAIYRPNPFYHYDNASFKSIVKNDTLYLVDGGEDNQNVPLYPLIQPERELDVIFAFDNSADTEQSWPNGASLVATYERQFLNQSRDTIFPHVPDTNSFVNLNLTARPTFFGCDAKNLTSLLTDENDEDLIYKTPLIVYTANRPFTYMSNRSTFELSYDGDKRNGVIKNGFEVSTRLNGTLDDEYKTCISCAIIRREQERQGIEQSDQCKKCFEKYCWNGEIDSSSPKVNFTTTGTTNGNEDDGNRTVSSAISLKMPSDKYAVYKALGYAFVAVIACTLSL